MIKHRSSREHMGKELPNEKSSESKLQNVSSKLSILNLDQTKDGLSVVSVKHSTTSHMDIHGDTSLTIGPNVQQFESMSPKSYQEAKDKWKELPPKKPLKLAPLVLPEDIKKAQLEKLKYIQIEGKRAAEKLATTGEISTEHQPRKERNHKQLESLEKIKLAEKTILENQKSPMHLLQEVPFLPAKITNSIAHRKFKESALPSKPSVSKTSISAKSAVTPDAQRYIPEENLVPSLHPVKGRIKLRHGKDYDNGTHDKSKPLKPLRLTFSNGYINEEHNIVSQQTTDEHCKASNLLSNAARRK
ncbi:hypothetical protein chiPu_0005671 [Chiloscyllium punctatum]|uniref:Uncharacterized protein n=1 Tax=Chiloscyllium punctatum TaxID=137246 RepID=A0A401SA14_CHIPU|nr:hypothetical protein [Chiloscyllium punctatum]